MALSILYIHHQLCMLKSNLIKLLSKLDEPEFRKFGKFVESPYFNNNLKLIDLFYILSEFYPDFESLEMSKENIFRKLYKKDSIVMGTMHYLISELQSLLEKFISIEKTDPLEHELVFLDQLGNFRLDKYYDKKNKEIKKKLERTYDKKNLLTFKFSEINRFHKIERKEFLTKKDSFKSEWTDPVNELFRLFIRNMIWNIELLSNIKQYHNRHLNVPMYKEIMDYIGKSGIFEKDIEMKIAFFRIKMLYESEDEYFYKLKDFINKKHKEIPPDLLEVTLTQMNNFATQKMLNGEEFHEEQFEIQNLYLKHVIKVKNDFIPVDVFFQIFAHSVYLGKIEWSLDFVNKFGKRLEPKFQNNALNYSLAFIHYINKEYDKALKQLSSIKNFSYIHYKPSVKMLQMKVFYDLNLISEAEDTAKAFLQFLRNDKLLNNEVRKTYSNFAGYFLKLLNAGSGNSSSNVSSLKHSLLKDKNFISGKLWLMSKLNDLESLSVRRKRNTAI